MESAPLLPADVAYAVDDHDEICSVNPAYDVFAAANGGEAVLSHRVLRRPLWDFLSCRTTIALYDRILVRARSGHHLSFPLRCDSPDRKRRLRIDIARMDNGHVEFRTRLFGEDPRPYQPLLDAGVARSARKISMCSWCRKVKCSERWLEVEEAIPALELFDVQQLPRVANGICDPCYRSVLKRLEEN